jgi:hypothetical protein
MSEKENDTSKLNRFIFKKALVVGLWGGIFWTLVWMFLHNFHMISAHPFIIWDKLFLGLFTFNHWYMKIIGIVLNSVLSMVLSSVYFVCFKKVKHWIMGIGYGIILWAIGALLIPIVLFNNDAFFHYKVEKHVGLLSLLILYGLFIGYTISFDYDHVHRKPENN